MGVGKGVWTAVRAELLRPGFIGADAMRTGARTETEAGGLAESAGLVDLAFFAVGAAAALTTGFAGGSANFLAAVADNFLSGSVAFLAVLTDTAGDVLVAALVDGFFSKALTMVFPMEPA